MSKLKVLVPLDGSSFSRQIVRQIRFLLDPGQYHITLLQVSETPMGISAAPPRMLPVGSGVISVYESRRDVAIADHPIYAAQVADSTQAAIEAELRVEARTLIDMGYSVSTLVRFGDPAEEIVDVADQQDVDLVAMATHGRSGLRRLIMGSVAERVLQNVSKPVLLVRPSAN